MLPPTLPRLANCRATRDSRFNLVSLPPTPYVSSRGQNVPRESRRVLRAVAGCSGVSPSLVRHSSTHPRLQLVTSTQDIASTQATHSPGLPGVWSPAPHAPVGQPRQAGVLPWSERKSPRGKPKTICTAGHACPNRDCDYYGNTDSTFHAVVGDGKRGADQIQWFRLTQVSRCIESARISLGSIRRLKVATNERHKPRDTCTTRGMWYHV
jgi:hypothetical protein